MPDITWIVVADGGRARVFQTTGISIDLQEMDDLVNDEHSATALPEKEAVALSESERTEKERERFAKRVADYLEQGRLHQRYRHLRLVIEPKFLGMVRADLSEETRGLISDQISEDLSELDTKDIEARLKRL